MSDNITQFQEIFQQAAVGMMILNLNTKNLWKTNTTMEKMLGYTAVEFSSMTLSEITHPDDVEKDEDLFQQVLHGNLNHYHQEKRYIRKNGEIFWGKLTFHLILYENQRWGFGIIEDINLQKQAEQTLWIKNQAIESSINAIAMANLEGVLTYVNPSFLKMWGYQTKEEVLNKPTISFWEKEENAIAVVQSLQDQGHWIGELVAVKKDSTTFLVELSATIVTDEEGVPVQMLASFVDITKRKEAEEDRQHLETRLRHAQKMEAIGTLSGGIAHDFNNLLFGILGYAEMMREELPSDHPLQRYAQSLITAGKRAKDLVRQILTFSRQDEQEFSKMQVIPIIKEVLKMMRSTLPSTVDIQQDLIGHSKSIWGSPIQIHQIIVNLCTNAEQAMRQTGGTLKISVQETELNQQEATLLHLTPGPFLKLTVEDTGPGMNAEIQERIFDPFFTTKPVGEGTGLGLAVVHGIVLKHQGAITVQSEPGKGAVFHIFLPTIEGKSDEQKTSTVEISQGRGCILVVDDEIFILEMIKKMLSRLGYQVTTIQNSPEALEEFYVNPKQFDLIITDQTMPKLTGYQLAREILSISPEIPIILMTGFSHQVSLEEAQKLGIREFISKPVEKETLTILVHDLLEEKVKNDLS